MQSTRSKLLIRETQVKTIMSNYFTIIGIIAIKKSKNIVWLGIWRKEILINGRKENN